MGKKSGKQAKRTPTATNNDSAAKTVATSTQSTTDLAPEAHATPTTSTEPPAHIFFAKFIEIASVESIKQFLDTAAYRSKESENLGLLWHRAYNEGYMRGRDVWAEKAEKNYEEGHKAGMEESKDNCRELFQRFLDYGKAEERAEWEAAGHGGHCFAIVAAPVKSSGTQTDETGQPLPQKPSSLETGTQTSL